MRTAQPRLPAGERTGERSRLARRLRRVLRGEVLFDAGSIGRYATDASVGQVEPLGVVLPADEADVAAVLELARELHVPVLPRGAGTSRFGQAIGEALVLDLSRHLDRIVTLDLDARTVEVQPGVILGRLNARLAPAGLWFPIDPCSGDQATIGGMAGNDAWGVRSIVHGTMVRQVQGIDALLADGTDEHFGPFGVRAVRPIRSARTGALVSRLFEIAGRERDEIGRAWPEVARVAGGYRLDAFHPIAGLRYTDDGSVNLAHLLVGSQGTLAHFRRLHLRLEPLPAHRVLAVWRFPSVTAAAGAAQAAAGLGPSALELLDAAALQWLRRDPLLRPAVELALGGARTGAALLLEFSGEAHAPLQRQVRALAELAADLGFPGAVVEVPGAAQQQLWALHRAAAGSVPPGARVCGPAGLLDDCAVPVDRLGEYVGTIEELIARRGMSGVWNGQAGAGMLQLRLLGDCRGARTQSATVSGILAEASALVGRLRGSPYGGRAGHGAGSGGSAFGPGLARAFAEVKALFDPLGLMNPGKIVPGAVTQPLREYPTHVPVSTALDWRMAAGAPTRSFDGAALAPETSPGAALACAATLCDGNGRCRALGTGDAMCPSFRVTRDERDAPRGRADTVRLALAGRFGSRGLASDEVADAMALCVGCKACSRECPNGVDVARMRIEALASRAAVGGLTAGERLLASLPQRAPMASRLAWLSNLLVRVPGMAALAERRFGLARRPWPTWRRDTFLRKRVHTQGPSGQVPEPSPAREVALFADCLHNHFDPGVLHAAVRVLGAAGLRAMPVLPAPGDAHPARPLCCGRSWLVNGLVDRARAEAQRTLAALAPLVERGIPVVGIEPSCMLTMRDEYRSLGLGEAAQRVAGGALLLEELLVRERAEGRPGPEPGPVPWKRALLHAHCHQDALDATGALRQVLGWIPGLEIAQAPAGCCGMGDGFGYQAARHEVSMQIAELGLLPAVRSVGADAVVVSNGFGCRRQIADGAARDAVHLARVLEAALAPPRAPGARGAPSA